MGDQYTAEGKTRIVQELVPGKQITIAHLIANPDKVLYRKMGLEEIPDHKHGAMGIVIISPGETAVIAADISLKAAGVEIGTIDRENGTLVITGSVSETESALTAVLEYMRGKMDFEVCKVTKT